MGTRFDSAPLQVPLDIDDPRWRRWFQDMWDAVQATSLPLPSTVTLGASPFIYTYDNGGQASVLINGGTVNPVELSRDGVTWFFITAATGILIPVAQGDRLRITYTAPPTVTLFLR